MKNLNKLTALCFLILAGILCSCKKEKVSTVISDAVTNFTVNRATCGGNITNEDSGTATDHGVCWSKNDTPAIPIIKLLMGLVPGVLQMHFFIYSNHNKC